MAFAYVVERGGRYSRHSVARDAVSNWVAQPWLLPSGALACCFQVDPVVFNMLSEDPGHVDYSSIGGLSEQIR